MNAPDRYVFFLFADKDWFAATERHYFLRPKIYSRRRFELFLLGEGEKKCTEDPDTRTPNSAVFKFNKEDHTLANILRAHLIKETHVVFAGYKIPHPLFATFELRVQTDGDISPREAMVNCCKALVGDLEILSREFTKEYELRKMVSGDGAATQK